jgi:UrcA family protein
MFTLMLLSLAAATGATDNNPIIIAEDRPSIRIALAGYDFAREQDVRRLKLKIRWAAGRVCVRGYGVSLYLERVECVKSAIADGDRQLGQLVAQSQSGVPLAASLSVTSH